MCNVELRSTFMANYKKTDGMARYKREKREILEGGYGFKVTLGERFTDKNIELYCFKPH